MGEGGEAVTLGTCSSSALDLSAGKMRSSGSITPVFVTSISFLQFPSNTHNYFFLFCYICVYILLWAANNYDSLVLWGIMRGKNRGTVKDFRRSYTHMDILTVAGQRRLISWWISSRLVVAVTVVGSGAGRGVNVVFDGTDCFTTLVDSFLLWKK